MIAVKQTWHDLAEGALAQEVFKIFLDAFRFILTKYELIFDQNEAKYIQKLFKYLLVQKTILN